MSDLPFDLGGGESGHVNWHNVVHGLVRGMVPVLAETDGSNQTAKIIAAMDEANPGDAIVFPPGGVTCDPWVVEKCLHVISLLGPFSSWLIPASNTVEPLVTFDVTVDSTFGIFGNYNPSMRGVGINRQGHMAGPCLHATPNAAHLLLSHILCSGGTRSIEHHAPNATFENVKLWDASDCMIDMDENGLELHMRHVMMSAQVQDLDTFWRVAISAGAAGGRLGAIYGEDVTGNTADSPGNPIIVGNGLVMTAPYNDPPGVGETTYTEVPTFLTRLILDNINGGGPVVDLENVQTVSIKDSWLNGTNGCVRMDGCINPHVEARTRGGTHTFEFVGRTTQGFSSRSEVFSGPAYKVSTATKPTVIDVDDDIAGATDVGQVTNDIPWFQEASRRTWGQRRFQGYLRRRELGTAPPCGYAVLVAGVATVNHPLVGVNTRVRISRERVGPGAPGEIFCSVVDNVVDPDPDLSSFTIRSTSLLDDGAVYWEFVGDGD